MLMQNRFALRNRGHVSLVLEGENPTSGGSSESETSDCAVKPTGCPQSWLVMTTIPVQKWPRVLRNRAGSIATLPSILSNPIILFPVRYASSVRHLVARDTHLFVSTAADRAIQSHISFKRAPSN